MAVPLIQMILDDLALSAQLDWRDPENRNAVVSRVVGLHDLADAVRDAIPDEIWKHIVLLCVNPEWTVKAIYWRRRVVEKCKVLLNRIG